MTTLLIALGFIASKIQIRATPAAVRELAEVVEASGHTTGYIIADEFPRKTLEAVQRYPKIEAR
jgi:hypothetical protein